LVIISEATISNAQQAWDQLLGYAVAKTPKYTSYRGSDYTTHDPEISKIKDCMKVLDKCPKVQKKIFKGTNWICNYMAKPVQQGYSTNIITIKFSKPDQITIEFSGQGWVAL